VASYTSCVKLAPDEAQYVSALRDAQVEIVGTDDVPKKTSQHAKAVVLLFSHG